MPELDLELVRHTLAVARKNGFSEVELGVGEDAFTARLKPMPRPQNTPASPADSVDPEPVEVRSTLVGYYRPARRPLEVGQSIQKGDTVALISALGIESEVESKVSGEVVEVLVEPDQPVEYGQALARVRI